MKRLFFILVFPIYTFIGSCCNKHSSCLFYDSEISFQGFDSSELDTIRVEIIDYKGAAYSIVDSYATILAKDYRYKQQDEFFIRLREKINKKYTYKIRLNNLGLEYTLNGFVIKRKPCDVCFGQGSDFTDYIGGYNLNGKYKDQEKITIYR
jgi:hypothetical protein